MTEEEAKAWLTDSLHVSRETYEKLDAFRAMLLEENEKQNLISAGSIPRVWARHIVDSAQLPTFLTSDEEERGGAWLDLGTGAGFPGMVLAILSESPITFVESRKRRTEFLGRACESLGLNHVAIHAGRLETMRTAPFSVITARAFAPLPKLLTLAHSFSTQKSVWLLPKGARGREEVESVRGLWKGVFHVEQSLTDAEAHIIVGRKLAPKGRS
jgi:16S rRNA (guanine527-N7)-methyltransferase